MLKNRWYVGGLLGLILAFASESAMGLDLLPIKKKKTDKSSEVTSGTAEEAAAGPGLAKRYWLVTNGSSAGCKVIVEINGDKASTVKRPEQALEVTDRLHPGLNRIRFTSKPTLLGKGGSGELVLTIGPESSREDQGGLRRTFIQLKENLVHFTRPAGHLGEKSVVEMAFAISEDPNPNLKKRYVLYSQGVYSGHLIHVALNGAPLLDVSGPGMHIDLNPYLKDGKNEFTFSASRMDGVPFTTTEREALNGKMLEVGVAIAGDYDPITYSEPLTQVSTVVARYTQPADQEEPEEKEFSTLDAE